MTDIMPTAAQITPTRLVPYNDQYSLGLFGSDGLSFKDVLDTVNPLQQLPVLGSLYRGVTGDTISTASQLAGGALIGGPLGFLMAAGGALFEAITGDDMVNHALSLADGSTPSSAQASRFYLKAKNLG